MSYLRLDNRENAYGSAMMTADGKFRYGATPLSGRNQGPVQPQGPAAAYSMLSMLNMFSPQSSGPGQSMGMGQGQYLRPVQTPQAQPKPKRPPLRIRGVGALIRSIGYPTIVDTTKGGIAIWASDTLNRRGYKFLHRVEIIDESVPSMYPVKHFSNVYIWVKISLTESMICNVNQMSTDIFFDRGKELLIVRSDCLDTAVSQAALVALYSQNKVSYYDIMNNSMLENYYTGVKKSKVRKALYTILSNLSKR